MKDGEWGPKIEGVEQYLMLVIAFTDNVKFFLLLGQVGFVSNFRGVHQTYP